MGELVAYGDVSVPILASQWKQTLRLSAKELQKLLADLAAEDFNLRQTASTELERVAAQHESALREALQKTPSLESRRRLERVLEQVEPQRLRPSRMLESLEQIGTLEARRFLLNLAEQIDDASLAAAAKAGLHRLGP